VADRDKALRLGGEGERLAVSLAVFEQLVLVALQELERDRLRPVDSVLLAELGEVGEVVPPAGDRRLGVVVDTHPEKVLGHVGCDRRHDRALPFRDRRAGWTTFLAPSSNAARHGSADAHPTAVPAPAATRRSDPEREECCPVPR
jgi:hypothetical protein